MYLQTIGQRQVSLNIPPLADIQAPSTALLRLGHSTRLRCAHRLRHLITLVSLLLFRLIVTNLLSRQTPGKRGALVLPIAFAVAPAPIVLRHNRPLDAGCVLIVLAEVGSAIGAVEVPPPLDQSVGRVGR